MAGKGKHKGVFLSLGSNLGDRIRNMERSMELIEIHIGNISGRSGIYESDAWGFESKNAFYNMCLEVRTEFSADRVMEAIILIENSMGRKRTGSGYSDRLIDIDLLFYNGLIINTSSLTLPHPMIEERRFVLSPLAEITPGFVHPVLNCTVADLLAECKDGSHVELI